jgi:hypothetical protein
MLLASTALGLGGSAWKTVPPSATPKIKDLLGIPPFFVLKVILPLGYPKEHVKPLPKRDVPVHENRYDLDKLKSAEEISEIMKKYTNVKLLNKLRAL